MIRIPVTFGFDDSKPIGFLEIDETKVLPQLQHIAFGYQIIEADARGTPIKTAVVQAALIPDAMFAGAKA